MTRQHGLTAAAVALWGFLQGVAAQYDSCTTPVVANVGNGQCDAELNVPSCGYDGGDCCSCTCIDSADHSCADSVFDCLYPGCNDAPTSTEETSCLEEKQGDGACDAFQNNHASCGYDGGDCCACSCLGNSVYSCGVFEFDCKDPACFDPVVVAEFPDCAGGWANIGDGTCNADTNVPSCGYDGGDCCFCTCSGSAACTSRSFECLDPDANDELYECGPTPPVSVPCSAEAQREWVVDDTAQARALTAAVNCSGGSFEVEWRGTVIVDEAIYVADGTTLTITGAAGSMASSVDGNSSTRLFTVVNAALHLDGLNVSYGASTTGGAIAAAGSTLTFNRTIFVGNGASGDGGAVFASDASSVSCAHGTAFVENWAGSDGGAMFVSGGSEVSCGGRWLRNFAGGRGGALRLEYGSSASWNEESIFELNAAGAAGGALALVDSSRVSWDAPTGFYYNSAGLFGGAVVLSDQCIVSWQADTGFFSNSAGDSGGALYVDDASNVSWSGDTDTVFDGNEAAGGGGALIVTIGSHISCTGNATTTFSGNAAVREEGKIIGQGAAVLVILGSSAVWSGGVMQFIGNVAAGTGSAVRVSGGSHVSWSGPMTKFLNNSAGGYGTLYVDGAEVSWSGETLFEGNYALFGGGVIYLENGSYVGWTGETAFSSNEAGIDGGAVVSPQLDLEKNLRESTLHIGAATTFSNNTSGSNGGAVALFGACNLEVDPGVKVTYTGNSAGVAGGAVFVSGAGSGPAFSDATFVSNSAQVGGAVSAVGSGNTKSVSEAFPPDPTTFYRCRFVGNRATTGGAIDSAAGYDSVIDCTFEDNEAGTGGALRLAGTTAIDGCSFVENFSDDGEGAAVSNIGTIARMANVSLTGNGFNCPAGMFLDYNTSGDPFEAVCDGCLTACEGCVFAEPLLAPICTEVVAHSASSGGKTILGALSIERGYWRATNSSEMVLACYHADACLGGVTGTSDYCLEGYEGPYCAICSDGYAAQIGFVCTKCSGNTAGIVLAVALGVVALIVAVAVVSYATTGEGAGKGRGLVERVARYIPLQSVKIVIVAWQILTQFTEMANISYPAVYQTFLDGLKVVNFDLSWILSAGCIVDVDFHDRLLMSTIGPIVAVLFLGCTYAAAVRIHRGAPETLHNVWHKHVSLVLLLTFVVYSSVSSVLFSTFACETLDDGKNYLRSDYRIECDSPKHRGFKVYAGFMIVLYTVGVPAWYAGLLFRDRDVLRKEQKYRGSSSRVSSTSDLWKPYKPSVFYYELIECTRRILLAGVVVFIYPNSAAQVAITLMIAFAFVFVSEGLAPYASRWAHWISRTGHIVVVVSMYVALLLKVDVSNERSSSQKVFEAILIAVHVVMVVVVLMEMVVMGLALKTQQHREDPLPRLRSGDIMSSGGGNKRQEEGPHWEAHSPFAGRTQQVENAKP